MSGPEETRAEALKRLDAQAGALEARTTRTPPDYGFQAAGNAYRLLAQLLGGTGVGLALGWIFDAFVAAARPWGTIVGVLVGFAVAIWLAYRSAQRMSAQMSKDMAAAPAAPALDDEDED
jgi:ATP synthase protein I